MTEPSPQLRQAVWEALLDADWSTRYWSIMARRSQVTDKRVNIFIAICSSAAVATWAVKAIPLVWQALSVITAIVSIVQSFSSMGTNAEQMFNAHAKWIEFEIAYQQLWDSLTRMSEEESWNKFHALRQSQGLLASECARLPDGGEKLKLKCKSAVLEARNQSPKQLGGGK